MILAILFLCSPTITELFDDRDGDSDKKNDVYWRTLLIVWYSFWAWVLFDINIFKSILLSIAIFFACFDYLIVVILKKRGIIETKESPFTYMSKSKVDSIWSSWNPWLRLSLRLVILIIAILVFIL